MSQRLEVNFRNCYREIDDEDVNVGDENGVEEVMEDGEELPPESDSESEDED